MTDSATSGDGQSPAFDVPSSEETQRRNSFYASVSREMVGLYKEQFGRGPTKARTNYAGPDCLVCTLEESLTPAERNMVALGEHQRLRDIRLFFQHAAEEEFVEIVERLSGRKVRGFVSGMDTEQDISSEVFYLEPRQDAEPGEENYP
jgi:uncharacterized protein YbcI